MSTILVTIPLKTSERQAIQATAPTFKIIEVDPKHEPERLLAEAPKATIWYGPGLDASIFQHATSLRWLQITAAGFDRYVFPEILSSQIPITNVRGMHAQTIADQVMMFVLALARQLKQAIHLQAAQSWTKLPTRSLTGDTMAVIGLGSIGQATAKRARAFGMRVIGTRFSNHPVPDVDVYPFQELETVLEQAEWIVLACPLTQQTTGMIGPKQLRAIGASGALINIGRGGLVNEPAMIDALQRGELGGAGLDVFAIEPLPTSSPLWYLPNVLITPHMSGDMHNYNSVATEMFCENLVRFQQGETLVRLYDKEKGY